MAGLTSTGFEAKTLEEILADIVSAERTLISSQINTASDSIVGQLNGIMARAIRQLWELAQEVYASHHPDSAEGESLTNVASITGTVRRPATKSTVTASVNLDAGTSIVPGDLVAHVDGNPDARFVNIESFTAGVTATYLIDFEAEETGPVRANAGTLTEIAEPFTGWNSVTNAEDAELGADVETDEELRTRRVVELTTSVATTVNAIRNALLQVEGVSEAIVLENDTDATVDGLPPHSIAAIVLGGDEDDIGRALFDGKAAGIQTEGDVTRVAVDSMGIEHEVDFYRPTEVPIDVEIDISVNTQTYVGETAVKEAIADWADANLSIGDDVLMSKIICEVIELAGVTDVVEVRLARTGSPTAANVVIDWDELATIDTGDITVTLV